jgi:hypothetical protein
MTALATVRTDLYDVLTAATVDAQVYRHRQTNYQYPAFVVGWPQSLDFRAAMGGQRDFVIDVLVAVEVVDGDSSDDLLSELLEGAVTAIETEPQWDIQPATDFSEELTADGRVIIWCRLPVVVYA